MCLKALPSEICKLRARSGTFPEKDAENLEGALRILNKPLAAEDLLTAVEETAKSK